MQVRDFNQIHIHFDQFFFYFIHRDCGMEFENNAEFANHIKNFCNQSNYGNIEALDRRLRELGANKPDDTNPAF